MLNVASSSLSDFLYGHDLPLLTHLNVSSNNISEMNVLSHVNSFKELTHIFMLNNPVLQFHDKNHVRCLIIAAIAKIKGLNGSAVQRYEKKDCDIYYLKNTFHEYFRVTGTNSLNYDLNDFWLWARPKYPLIEMFVEKMGNPYPHEERFYETPPNTKPMDQQNEQVIKQKLPPSDLFAVFTFYMVDDSGEMKLLEKKLPRNITIGFLKKTVKGLKKFKESITKMQVEMDGQITDLIGDMKKMTHFVEACP